MPVKPVLMCKRLVTCSASRTDYLSSVTKHTSRTACLLSSKTYSYGQILSTALEIKRIVQEPLSAQATAGRGPRIGLYAAPGPQYVAGTWASWLMGGIVVPLATSHPPRELDYVMKDASISLVLAPQEHLQQVQEAAGWSGVDVFHMPQLTTAEGTDGHLLDGQTDPSQGALIMYTSGTTGKPKGVLHTHGSLLAQVHSLVDAWEWTQEDRILHALPLHHTHGIVNALYCAHYAGAAVEFMPKFSPNLVWQRLMSGEVTVFMGVPTMYSLLLTAYDAMAPGEQAKAREAAAQLRLTVSGSAACPLPVMARWQKLSGKPLLERYGMTEIGMALSNPYKGERRPGYVGLPLPGVQARIQPLPEAEDGATASTSSISSTNGSSDGNGAEGITGELLIRGDTLFSCYWNRPEATAEAFDSEGWFHTGDTASLDGEPPYYRIMGRTSVDIIKTSGYKVSALEIENVILEHPQVAECAVVGVPDETYGQVLAAMVVVRAEGAGTATKEPLDKPTLQAFCRERLPPYKVPRTVLFVESIPRNAMGKVNKKELVKGILVQ